MDKTQIIYDAIAGEAFSETTLQLINNYVNDILNGTEYFPRFNLSEHAGLCTAGAPLIGASIVAGYTRASVEASFNASGREGSPYNWDINVEQEKQFEDGQDLEIRV